MEDIINEIGEEVKKGNLTWKEATEIFNEKVGTDLSQEAFRSRYRKLQIKKMKKTKEIIVNNLQEYETKFNDETIEAQKIVEYNKEIMGDKNKLLKYLGYDPSVWEFVYFTISTWEQHTKEQNTKQLYAVKYKIKPIIKQGLTLEEAIEIAKQEFKKKIKPIKLPKQVENKELDDEKMLEIPGIELHLGKMAWNGDTGQDYDKNIAQERFYKILEEIVNQQEQEKCGKCLLCIGNDFFNSDTVNATTTKGTPQTNDLRWKKMFLMGLQMYKDMILTLRSKFNEIEIRLVSGNHDEMASFYLYMALSQYFSEDNVISFSDNYKQVQCCVFGKNLIAFCHGDANLKRLMKSIPIEFYREWGTTVFRELHLGHLHKEVVVDDESGMITRRIGSPTGTDQWHYEERFIGSTQKAQTFVWHKEYGLKSINYINFDKEKVLKLGAKK